MEEDKNLLFKIIKEKVIQKNYLDEKNGGQSGAWIFDFKRMLLNQESLKLITRCLWEEIKDIGDFQIGGLESASIPLVTSLVLYATEQGVKVNGFYIRKGRKKTGLYKVIEGELNDLPVILVDDLMNSSSTFIKQIEILHEHKKNIKLVLSIVRFKEIEEYELLGKSNVEIRSVFTLKEFDLILPKTSLPVMNNYAKRLIFSPENKIAMHVITKSTPVVMDNVIFFGTDEGIFWAIDVKTGEKKWKCVIGKSVQGKGIFSSPLVYEDYVFFGAYDGTLYALDRFYGHLKWSFSGCDWIGSSPEISAEHGLIFIGLEHGLTGRHGSVVALNIFTGEKKWEYVSAAFTHATPLYIPKYGFLCVGGNEGVLRTFNANDGELIWQFETEGGGAYLGDSGFSKGDIKLAPVFDEETDLVAFSSMDGWVYVLNCVDGSLRFRFSTDYYDTTYKSGVYGKPLFTKKYIIFGALDKHVYCYDKKTGKLIWKHQTKGRVFATPVQMKDSIFIGSNDGCLYEFDINTGTVLSKNQFSERITNPIIYDQNFSYIYVVTQLNQIYELIT